MNICEPGGKSRLENDVVTGQEPLESIEQRKKKKN